MGKKSFSLRLSINIIMVVSILSIIVLAIVAISSNLIIVEESKRSAENMLAATIKDIEKDLVEIESATQNSSWWAYANMNNSRRLYQITQSLVSHNDKIVGSAVAFDEGLFRGQKWFSPYSFVDPETGEIQSKQLGNENYDYLQMQWFTAVKEDYQAHWSDPYLDEGGGGFWMVTYSVPILDTAGQFLGVITADLSLEWLQQKMKAIKPYPNSVASISNQNQRFLASTLRSDFDLTGVDSQVNAEMETNEKLMEMQQALAEGRDSIIDININGESLFIVFGSLTNRWSASISFQYEDVLRGAAMMLLIIALVGLFGLLLMFILCYIFVLRMTKPITKLTDAAMVMSKGNFDATLPEIKTDDEIMSLRNAFAYMQASLKEYIAELKITTASNERMESELNVAKKIQTALLVHDFPKGVSTDAGGNDYFHYDIHAFLEPAKEVGGDLYDFRIKDDTLYFAVGDVSGKGVPAALLMGITRVALRFVSGMGLPMDEVDSRVNNILSETNDTGMFVTLFCGRIDLKTGKCRYCNAGHNPIVVKPANGDAYFLHAKPNIAVGLFPDFPYQGEELDLHPGDKLLFYTDGVTEAEKADKSLFGDDRLLAWANASQAFLNGTSQEAVDDLYATVKQFTEGNEPNDDITIMIIGL